MLVSKPLAGQVEDSPEASRSTLVLEADVMNLYDLMQASRSTWSIVQ